MQEVLRCSRDPTPSVKREAARKSISCLSLLEIERKNGHEDERSPEINMDRR
jgi:hypothetical protein